MDGPNCLPFFRNQKLKDQHEEINFQTDFVMDLAKEADYGHDLDVSDIFHSWEHDKGAFSQDFVQKTNTTSEFFKTYSWAWNQKTQKGRTSQW